MEIKLKTKIIMTQRSGHTKKKSPQQQKTHTTRQWLSKNTHTENRGEKRDGEKRHEQKKESYYTMNTKIQRRKRKVVKKKKRK